MMNEFNLTEYIARKTMALKDQNTYLSFVSMVWRDKPILIMYNNSNNMVAEYLLDPVLQTGDEEKISNLVKNFLT